MQVFIVGAGSGDPELITVKGDRLLRQADVIIYAGSLVNPLLLQNAKQNAEIYDSAKMTLPEVIFRIEQAVQHNKIVVRLHTGDPSLYGAIQEQMDELQKRNIEFLVIPGVSSFLASAAALKQEYTLPGVSQTVIITRQEGRTGVPVKEKLQSLAEHQATMCIFLSTHMLSETIAELLAGGYSDDTPAAVVYKASWPEEKIVRGVLSDIVDRTKAAGITRTAMIIVGRCLDTSYNLSCLYDPGFSHMFRQAEK